MLRFRLVILSCIVFSFSIGIVYANPAPQPDRNANVITPDNIDDLELIFSLNNHNDTVFNDFYVAADGRIATISGENHAQVWGIDPVRESAGEYIINLRIEAEACDGTCIFTAVALKNNHIAVGTLNGYVLIYDIDTGDLLHINREHVGYRVNDIMLTSSGEDFASIDEGGTIGFSLPLRDLDDVYFHDRWLFDRSPLYALAIDPTSQQIAAAGGDALSDEPNTAIHTWDNVQLGSHSIPEIFHWEGSDYPVHALAYSPDGQLLVSGDGHDDGDSSTIRLWDSETGIIIGSITFNEDDGDVAYPESIVFSPDGSLMAVSFATNQVLVWEVDDLPTSGTVSYTETSYHAFDIGGGEIIFSPDGLYLYASMGAEIQIWDVLVDD